MSLASEIINPCSESFITPALSLLKAILSNRDELICLFNSRTLQFSFSACFSKNFWQRHLKPQVIHRNESMSIFQSLTGIFDILDKTALLSTRYFC